MMRAIWSGSIAFGLVTIPVKLYSAVSERELSFKLLHEKDLGPIKYARICREDGKEIPYEEVVKGYEYQKGDFVVLTDEDFRKADLRKTKTIDIQEFVDEIAVDPKYFSKPYFLGPDKGSEKPYALLRESMYESGKSALGKFVLRNKEVLCLLRPEKNIIELIALRFADELRAPEGIKVPDASIVSQKEIGMALKLIEQFEAPFKPEQYKETFTQNVKKIIEEKAKGKRPKAKGKAPEPIPARDIMEALKLSLEKERRKVEK